MDWYQPDICAPWSFEQNTRATSGLSSSPVAGLVSILGFSHYIIKNRGTPN